MLTNATYLWLYIYIIFHYKVGKGAVEESGFAVSGPNELSYRREDYIMVV